MLQNLFENVIRVSVSASAVIALLLLLTPLIRKRYSPKWRYYVWLILAVRLLIPLSIAIPQEAAAFVPAPQSITAIAPFQEEADVYLGDAVGSGVSAEQSADASASAAETAAADTPSLPLQTVTLREALPALWLAGVALFLLYHFIGYYIFKRSVRRFSASTEDTHARELFDEVREELKTGRGVRLTVCKKIQSPMIAGFFRPTLLLPNLEYDDPDMTIILRHELIHHRRGDVWYKLLMTCAAAAHWFNPLVWLMAHISNKDLELACDSEMVAGSGSSFRRQYSETILSAIHSGNRRLTAFSTYFYGGEKMMKERFANIFDMRKKRRGIATLCAILIVAGVAGGSAAYGDGDGSGETSIDNISNLSAGNSYSLIDGEFVISYGAESSAVVPLAVDTEDEAAYFSGKAVYISKEVTAVAYGGSGEDSGEASPVGVLISNDMGKTWSTYTVPEAGNTGYSVFSVGFSSIDDGWLVLTSGVAMGLQYNRIFQTSDSGASWHEIGNTNDVYARVVTGTGFADDNIGFVSFRYDMDESPVMYRTDDGGETWTQCALEIPGSFESITSYATALSPVFCGANGILPVTFRNNSFGEDADTVDVTVWYETSDYGKTWTFDEKYNLALIWADAWKTRDGRARYEIMSSQMQEDFREQQSSPDYPDVIYYSIRWSSPWVVSYDIALNDQAVVTYLYTDSTASTYKGVERLSFGEENGRTVVTASETEIELEEYVDTSDWQTVHTDLFTCSMPPSWSAQVTTDEEVGFYAEDGRQIGTLSIFINDDSDDLNRFIGNHAEIRSTKTLDGCNYAATKATVRRTQPAAAQDDSYVDEFHIYLIPDNSQYVYDLCFTSELVSQKADEIARSLVIDTDRAELYGQILNVGYQWAAAVQNREGKMQYDLMSAALQESVYAEYEENHWVTGVSSPWVDSYRVEPGDHTAVVTYTYMTSDGFAGYYEQTLSFAEEDGRMVISGVTEPDQPGGQNYGVVISYLSDSDTYLSADKLENGMFSDMTLCVGGRTKSFSWETCSETAFLPELDYADIDGDRQNELIVILCEGEGTGVLAEEIHVIDQEDFSEIRVQDPIAALKDRVVSTADGDAGVTVTIDGTETFTLSKKEAESLAGESSNWFESLATGSAVDYSVDGGRISAEVGAQLSPAGFIGDFQLTYTFEDGELAVGSIGFSKEA